METTIVCWGYIGMTEKKMETTIVYWGYIGIMENSYIPTDSLRRRKQLPCAPVMMESVELYRECKHHGGGGHEYQGFWV